MNSMLEKKKSLKCIKAILKPLIEQKQLTKKLFTSPFSVCAP